MFNHKKHVYSVDLRQETLKKMFGTKNPRELATYISENIDQELGDALMNGEISVDDVYIIQPIIFQGMVMKEKG